MTDDDTPVPTGELVAPSQPPGSARPPTVEWRVSGIDAMRHAFPRPLDSVYATALCGHSIATAGLIDLSDAMPCLPCQMVLGEQLAEIRRDIAAGHMREMSNHDGQEQD